MEVRQFSFLDIYRQIRHFENDYHWFTAGFIKKSRHLEYQNAAFQKEQLSSYELHAVALVLWN